MAERRMNNERTSPLICFWFALQCRGNIVICTVSNQSIAATVKWCSRRIIGVEFHRLLSLAEFADWIATD